MAKLPDATSFGQSPVARPVGPVSVPSGGGIGPSAKAQATQQLGEKIFRIAEKRSAEADTLRAEDAFNQLREKQLNLSIGDDGFTKKRGADAVNVPIFDDYQKRFDQDVKEITDGLANNRQRELFKRRSDVAGLQFKQDVINHVSQEQEEYSKGVYQGTIAVESRNAVERYRDPAGVALSIQRIDAAISQEAERNGWSPDVTQATKMKAASTVNRNVVERMLANDDDISATNYYKSVKKSISGDDAIAVEAALEVGSTRGEAQRQADRIMSKSEGDMTLALESVRAIKNPKVRERATSLVRDAIAENKAAEKDRDNQAFIHAFKMVDSTGDVESIPPDVQVQLSVSALNALDERANEIRNGKTPTTDNAAWAAFYPISRDSQKLADMSEQDFYQKYWLKFDQEKRDRAASLRDAAIKAHVKDDKDAKNFLRSDLTLKDMVSKKVMAAGLIPATKAAKDYTQEDEFLLANVTEEASKELERLQVQNKRKATTEEEAAVVNRLLLDKIKVRIDKPFWRDSEKTVGELTPDEMAKAYVPYKNVPMGDREDLVARARSLGVRSSEDKIAKAYTTWLMTQNLPAADRRARIDAILRED